MRTTAVQPNVDSRSLAPTREAIQGVTVLRAGSIGVSHQALDSLSLTVSGASPVVLYLFSPSVQAPDRPQVVPAGSFSVLQAQPPVTIEHPEPLEMLAVVWRDLDAMPSSSGREKLAIGLFDPGVRSAAHELRRVLLREKHPDLGYLEDLGRALVRRAFSAAEPAARAPREQISPAKLRRVLTYIDDRLTDPLAVDELAAAAGLSRAHFSRAFHAATGESPHRYILARRLNAVRAALEATDADISSLAAEYGFSSHAHLTRAFANAFGAPPAVHRRRSRQLSGSCTVPGSGVACERAVAAMC